MDKKGAAILTIAILQIIFSAGAISSFNPLNTALNFAGVVSIISLILSAVILVYSIGLLQEKKSAPKGFICCAYAIIAVGVIATAYSIFSVYSAAMQQVGAGVYLLYILRQLLPLAVSVVFYCIAIKVLSKK